jgi:hypothetical protein
MQNALPVASILEYRSSNWLFVAPTILVFSKTITNGNVVHTL